jgi:ABC-2 type transport system permease protein
VLDRQSGAIPIPVEGNVGGIMLREIALAAYPYIVDVRGTGLDDKSPITGSLGQIEMPWVAPVLADDSHNKTRKITTLLRSSAGISNSNDLMPNYSHYRQLGFAVGNPTSSQPLTVMLEGSFDSGFRDRKAPVAGTPDPNTKPAGSGAAGAQPPPQPEIDSVIQHSPDSARLIVVGSSSAFSDQAVSLISEVLGSRYTKAMEFAQNVVDWSLEDQGLLAIRSRGHFARTLEPLNHRGQQIIESMNYGVALAALGLVWLLNWQRRRRLLVRHDRMLQEL